ncbi:hypothetical protein ACQPT2_12685 [Erwinia amylovora]
MALFGYQAVKNALKAIAGSVSLCQFQAKNQQDRISAFSLAAPVNAGLEVNKKYLSSCK